MTRARLAKHVVRTACLCLAAVAYARTEVAAAPPWQELALGPPATHVRFTTYALGFWPLPGEFTHFTGLVRVNPAHPSACSVALDIWADSLTMADPDRARTAMGPTLLDRAQFPQLSYRGNCSPGRSEGLLTLHGITRPVTFATHRDGERLIAEGMLRRTDFGIAGLHGLLGRMIRMTVVMRPPSGMAALIDP